MNDPVTFRTTILSAGKTAAGIVVPPEAVEALGAGKRPKVVVTMNGFTYRSSIAVMGGDFMIGVSNEVRGQSGLVAGQEVYVELKVDTEEREVVIPSDLEEALEKSPSAKAKFESLSYSKKRFYVLPIEAAKAPETRQKRIEKTIQELSA